MRKSASSCRLIKHIKKSSLKKENKVIKKQELRVRASTTITFSFNSTQYIQLHEQNRLRYLSLISSNKIFTYNIENQAVKCWESIAIFSQNLNGIDCLNKKVNRYHSKIGTNLLLFPNPMEMQVSYLGYLAETHQQYCIGSNIFANYLVITKQLCT